MTKNPVVEKLGFARFNGYSIMENNEIAVMIISPENSYYTEQNIFEHLQCCESLFSKVYVMIPQGPLKHNYLAIGKNEKYALNKARLKCNNIRNKALRSIEEISELKSSSEANNVGMLNWYSDIEINKEYRNELSAFINFYQENGLFKTDVNDAVECILGKKSDGKLLNDAIKHGSNYVLEEMAFMSAAPKILGSERICFTYHRDWNIFENYINGIYDGKIKNDLGFVIIK